MELSTLASLRCGPRTVAVAMLWIGTAATVYGLLMTKSLSVNGAVHILFMTIGCLYGLAGWGSWLATGLRHAWARAVTRGALTLVVATALNQLGGGSGLIRFVIYLGGLVVAQSALFFLLSFPDWRFGRSKTEAGARQFAIAELMFGTTAVAALLGIAIHYQPPIDPSEYWQVLAGIWIFFPILWAIGCGAALHRRPVIAALLAIAALGLVVAGAFVLGYWQIKSTTNSDARIVFYASLYGMISLGSVLTLASLTLAGRLDHAATNAETTAPQLAEPGGRATLLFDVGESTTAGASQAEERQND